MSVFSVKFSHLCEMRILAPFCIEIVFPSISPLFLWDPLFNAVAYKPRAVEPLICQTLKHFAFLLWIISQIRLKYFSRVLWDISFDLCKIFPSRAGGCKWGSLNRRLGLITTLWPFNQTSNQLNSQSRNTKYKKYKISKMTDTNTYTKVDENTKIHK